MRWFLLAVCVLASSSKLLAQGEPAGKRGTFQESLKELRQGVFIIGTPGGHGTAWVISKKNRLLITNAHVADIYSKAKPGECKAMMNGSGQTYEINGVWYHPGVRRIPAEGANLSVRATNHLWGDVYPNSPDLAILRLTFDGPDLPVELPVADSKTLLDLQSTPVAIFGFPGHDTRVFPKPGEKAQATFHEGVVSRVTDFAKGAGTDQESQALQYTMETFGGFSGSPIFLRSGEVVGIHNSARRADPKNPASRMIAHGIRADSLWELVAAYNLETWIPVPVKNEQILFKRWSDPDPAMTLALQLRKLRIEAHDLIHNQQLFAAGLAKCAEAIELHEAYAPIYITRCDAYVNWYAYEGAKLSFEKKKDLLTHALEAADKLVALCGQESVQSLLLHSSVLINLANLTNNRKLYFMAMDDADAVLRVKKLTLRQRARATSQKAAVYAGIERGDEARLLFQKSLQIDPDSDGLWTNRANFFQSTNPAQAKLDHQMSANLRKKTNLLNRSKSKDLKVIITLDNKLATDDTTDARGCYYHSWQKELEEGYFYQIDLKNPDWQSEKDLDPLLRLLDSKGKLLIEDDDGGAYPNARMFFTVPKTDSYQFTVTSSVARQTGPYVLTIRKIAKDD